MEIMRTLYHVTMLSNIDSIFEDGLLPHYAKGKMKVNWLVDFERTPWAISHTAMKNDISPARLVVFVCAVAEPALRRWSLQGVLTCASRIVPISATGAQNILFQYEQMLEAREREFQKHLLETEKQLKLL